MVGNVCCIVRIVKNRFINGRQKLKDGDKLGKHGDYTSPLNFGKTFLHKNNFSLSITVVSCYGVRERNDILQMLGMQVAQNDL